MFTIQQYRNTSVSNIKFENNAVVLMTHNVSSNGNSTTKVLQFPNCPDTKPLTIIKHLLKAMLAEYKVTEQFNDNYRFFATGTTVNGVAETVATGISAKRKFLPYLRTAYIFKTDSNGKLSHAISCDKCTTLADTALNIKTEQVVTLYKYNSAQFRSALHHTASAILEQCTMYQAIESEFASIDNGLIELAEREQRQATGKSTDKSTGKSTDKSTDKSTGKSTDKSTGKSSNEKVA